LPIQQTDGWYEQGVDAMRRQMIRRRVERLDPVKQVAERPPVEDRTRRSRWSSLRRGASSPDATFRTNAWKTRSDADSENAASWAPAPGASVPHALWRAIYPEGPLGENR
jgi:hypothetical protein